MALEVGYLLWVVWYAGLSIPAIREPGDRVGLIGILLLGLVGFVVSLTLLAIGSLPLLLLRGRLGWPHLLAPVIIPAVGLAAIAVMLVCAWTA